MANLQVYIVDDEHSARDLIMDHLKDEHEIEIAGYADQVAKALEEILKIRPDVILLDIQMPVQDGFCLVRQLQQHDLLPEIIFITAHEKYAMKAIKSSAFDYLLKPVRKEDLLLSLGRLAKKVEVSTIRERFNELLHQLSDHKKLKFKNRTGFCMIDPEEILYFRADSNYTVIELDNGRSVTVSQNLGKIEEMLPERTFCRVSRSNIINIQYLTLVDRKSMTCELVNSSTHELPISRRHLRELEACCDRLFSSKGERL